MAIPRDFVQDLCGRIDIEDVISSYVDLKRAGRNVKGLCPFHNEKTPSFTVFPDTKSFYCFGCNASGDAISFIMRIENLAYVEAVKLLADRVGMAMPDEGYDDSLAKLRVRILNANRDAARFYYSLLREEKGRPGLEYYRKRRLSDEIITHFGLGYAPDEWQALYNHLRSLGYNDNELLQANLVRKSQKTGRLYDNFRNRVMFPIMDYRGNVIAFSGRRINEEDNPKYVNTADTPVFKKGDGVFALNFAKNSGTKQLILAEGQMDVIAFHEFGFTNAIATLGTALTKEQANLISRYADELLICYDNDEAGRKATARALQILGETGMKLKVVNMEGGKDADEILRTHGKEKVNSLIKGSENEIEYRIGKELERYNVLTDDGKLKFLSAAAQILAECTPMEREIYSQKLANEFNISKDAFDSQIKSVEYQVRKRKREEKARAETRRMTDSFSDENNPERTRNLRAAKAEETLIASLMRNPDFLAKIKDKFTPEDFVTEFNKRVIKELIGLIEGGYSTSVSMFNEGFTPKEINSIVRISRLSEMTANTVRECEDCIAVIKDEKTKNHNDIENMNDEEFLRLFKKK